MNLSVSSAQIVRLRRAETTWEGFVISPFSILRSDRKVAAKLSKQQPQIGISSFSILRSDRKVAANGHFAPPCAGFGTFSILRSDRKVAAIQMMTGRTQRYGVLSVSSAQIVRLRLTSTVPRIKSTRNPFSILRSDRKVAALKKSPRNSTPSSFQYPPLRS